MDITSKKRHRAFTTRFGGKTNVLFTAAHISLPFDPSVDQNKTPPTTIECRAIWDTGATNSVITKGLAQKVGLVPTGKEKVANTSSVELRNNFLINVMLPNKVIISYLKVTECEDVLGNGNADMLIGMDVIGRGDFAVTYENGRTVMSFIMPSINTIDFVPISETEDLKQVTLEDIRSQKQARSLHQLSKKTLRAKHKKERQNRKKNRRRH